MDSRTDFRRFVNLRQSWRPVAVVVALLMIVRIAAAQSPEATAASVGMPVTLDQLVLPGSELEPIPLTDKTPVVIRIDRTYPHGTAMRYDLVYYGLEPGDYDLSQFLRRKDGTSTADLPKVPVRIETLLPPGQIEPTALTFRRLPWLGGYRLLMIALAVFWIAGLVWLLYPRKKPAAKTVDDFEPQAVSLADRLRPLVSDAMAGRLPPEKLAELERALIVCWRRRLGLQETPPADALARLRQHPEASPLMNQLEVWLHRPPGGEPVDVNALLKPYQNLAATELEPLLQETRS